MDASEPDGPLMKTAETCVTIERALELTGYGRYTFLFTLVCGFCLSGATSDIYSIGYLLPAAECDLNLNTTTKSLLAGAGIIGMIISANIWGFLSDRFGRKKIIVYAGLGAILCSISSAFFQSFWPFLLFRCLSGAFITGTLTTLFAYSGEFISFKYRSKSIIFIGILQNLSSIYVPLLAWLLLPLDYSFSMFGYEYHTWRIFMLLNTSIFLISIVAISFFPESPKFLLSNGDLDGAIKVLKKLYYGNHRGITNKYPVDNILKEKRNETTNQMFLLFNKKHLNNILCTSYLQFGNFAVSTGLWIWYADILNIQSGSEKGLTVCEAIQNGKKTDSTCDNQLINVSVFTQNLWIGLLYIVGQLIIIWILKYCKKTSLQSIFAVISGLCATVMMFMTSTILINILFVIFLVLPGLCLVIVNALVVDLFPTYLRSSAISFSITMGRISGLLTTSTVGYLIQFNCTGTFSIFAGIMITCALVAIILRSKDKPESK